ncbi:MAG: ribonuclease D [Alphaproteobacteria bacterium]|nr:ribonuclease D [Alphaproteobacteria bacterium]
MTPEIHYHKYDLPLDVDLGNVIAVDTETMGLNPHRDPLCLVQLSGGDGVCHLVHLDRQTYDAPNLKAILSDTSSLKIFHFARFDIATIAHHLNVLVAPVFCTKIASKLTRTYTSKHGLKDLCQSMLGIDISKEQQMTDWGSAEFTPEQLKYAATDVLHLHALKDRFVELLHRENRTDIAEACFSFLPYRGVLDLLGYEDPDIFLH